MLTCSRSTTFYPRLATRDQNRTIYIMPYFISAPISTGKVYFLAIRVTVWEDIKKRLFKLCYKSLSPDKSFFKWPQIKTQRLYSDRVVSVPDNLLCTCVRGLLCYFECVYGSRFLSIVPLLSRKLTKTVFETGYVNVSKFIVVKFVFAWFWCV